MPGLGWAGLGGAEWEVPLPTATFPPSIGLALGPLCTGVSWTAASPSLDHGQSRGRGGADWQDT